MTLQVQVSPRRMRAVLLRVDVSPAPRESDPTGEISDSRVVGEAGPCRVGERPLAAVQRFWFPSGP